MKERLSLQATLSPNELNQKSLILRYLILEIILK